MAKDVVTAAAAIAAAAVAAMGLKAWRRQLLGHAEYELSRRLLRAVYRARDELHAVRNPLILASEFTAALQSDEHKPSGDPPISFEDREAAVYGERWKRLASALSDLQVEVTEAEVLWGRSIVERLKPLRECVSVLYTNLTSFLRRGRRGSGAEPAAEIERIERIERIIYKISDDPQQDPFTGQVAEAVAQIEEFIRPHLKP
jgi:hypothetical protein